MDILAHALWAGAGMALARRRWPISPRTVMATVVLATLPDLFHLLPIAGWWAFGDGSLEALRVYAVALPGQEPALPHMVESCSHHLHCVAHSAIIAAAVTLFVLAVRLSL